MMMKKKIGISLLAAIYFAMVSPALAQEINQSDTPSVITGSNQERNFKKELLNVLYSHIDKPALSQSPKGAFNMTCIALVTDEKGKIIGAYTALDLSKTMKAILKPGPDMLAAFQKNSNLSGHYKNKTVIFPVLMVRWGTEPFENNKDFAHNIDSLWPDFPPDNTRPVVLLRPMIYTFDFPKRH